ncbi:MAG: 6-phosphogluconolactonase [Solirubrobacteraceae bacterium]|nr:6-phosphogluconolactonase [Patulibacter sp.]
MRGGKPAVVVFEDAGAIAAAAANIIDARITEKLSATGRADIAISGGRIAGPLFDDLTKRRADWTGVHLWIADERCVPYDDPDSNVKLVRERLPAPGSVLHAPPPDGDPEKRALAYSFQLKERVLDLVFLGLGEDAHTASLFPDNPAVDDERTIVPVFDSPKPPAERTSLSLGTLTAIPVRLFLVTGEGKREALGKLLGEPTRSAPSSLLPAEGTTVLADHAAAG